MSAITIQQMAARVAELMEARLGTRGSGLEAKVRRAGRRLPSKVRSAASDLAMAAAMAQNPKLLLQIDHDALARAYDLCVTHLNSVNPRARFMNGVVSVAASIAFSLLAVALILLAFLHWRGFI